MENNSKVAILSAFGLFPMLEYELDIAQQELDQGNLVYFLYCGSGQDFCSANPNCWSAPKFRYCLECKSKVRRGISHLQVKTGDLHLIDYEKLSKSNRECKVLIDAVSSARDSEELRNLADRFPIIIDADIYKAAYSSLITDMPASNPNIDNELEKFKLELVVGIRAAYSALEVLEKIRPNVVYIYNGRIVRYRPLMRLCQNKKIELRMYEYPYFGHESYPVMLGTYVHDVNALAKFLKETSDSAEVAEEVKINAGAAWFSERINPNSKLNPFPNKQEKNKLPDSWEEGIFNVVFFPSTEHEVTSIDEVTHLQIYESQVEGVYKIVNDLKGKFHLTVRMHPNNYGDEDLLKKYLLLEKNCEFIKIVLPNSLVDTYALIAASDLVMVHGSTVGAEAAFMEKRVLSIGRSQYDFFNTCAYPKNHQEVLQILINAVNGDFSVFPEIGVAKNEACKYAHALINIGRKSKYVKKNSYRDGRFISRFLPVVLKANFAIRLYNRLLDAPNLLSIGIKAFFGNSSFRSRFFKNPSRESIQYIKYIFKKELS